MRLAHVFPWQRMRLSHHAYNRIQSSLQIILEICSLFLVAHPEMLALLVRHYNLKKIVFVLFAYCVEVKKLHANISWMKNKIYLFGDQDEQSLHIYS